MGETQGTAICPECGQPFHVELTDVDVAWVWHGVCCGWGHTPSSKDVTTYSGDPAAAERAGGAR